MSDNPKKATKKVISKVTEELSINEDSTDFSLHEESFDLTIPKKKPKKDIKDTDKEDPETSDNDSKDSTSSNEPATVPVFGEEFEKGVVKGCSIIHARLRAEREADRRDQEARIRDGLWVPEAQGLEESVDDPVNMLMLQMSECSLSNPESCSDVPEVK